MTHQFSLGGGREDDAIWPRVIAVTLPPSCVKRRDCGLSRVFN